MEGSSDDRPRLLEPERAVPEHSSQCMGRLIVTSAFLLMLAWGAVFMETNVSAPAKLMQQANRGSEHGIVSDVDPADIDALSAAIQVLRLDAAEKAAVRDAVERGNLRLGLLMIWDYMDQDGDMVAVTAGGYVQHIVIGSQPSIIVIPYEDTPMMALTALQDGCSGCGGITVAAGTRARPMTIRPLPVGETVTVALQ